MGANPWKSHLVRAQAGADPARPLDDQGHADSALEQLSLAPAVRPHVRKALAPLSLVNTTIVLSERPPCLQLLEDPGDGGIHGKHHFGIGVERPAVLVAKVRDP